jgi:hypothetical protein
MKEFIAVDKKEKSVWIFYKKMEYLREFLEIEKNVDD